MTEPEAQPWVLQADVGPTNFVLNTLGTIDGARLGRDGTNGIGPKVKMLPTLCSV